MSAPRRAPPWAATRPSTGTTDNRGGGGGGDPAGPGRLAVATEDRLRLQRFGHLGGEMQIRAALAAMHLQDDGIPVRDINALCHIPGEEVDGAPNSSFTSFPGRLRLRARTGRRSSSTRLVLQHTADFLAAGMFVHQPGGGRVRFRAPAQA